jgi:archaellum biogenesis protein FlaJ (TadC family)
MQADPAFQREQVLARRRIALLALGAAVPVTLILAIVTGSVPLLIANIVVGMALAGYIALLLRLKQSQQVRPPTGRALHEDDSEMQVLPPRM